MQLIENISDSIIAKIKYCDINANENQNRTQPQKLYTLIL